MSVFALTEDVELLEIGVVGESADVLVDLPECDLVAGGRKSRVFRGERRLLRAALLSGCGHTRDLLDRGPT